MLCNTCKNKYICKHYEYIKNIEIDISIKIDKCELYSNNSNSNNTQPLYNPDKRPAFRQPLPSRGIDDEKEDVSEDEEKVFVNIDDCNEPQNISIVDMFYERGQNND
jgi:hypothetical protein